MAQITNNSQEWITQGSNGNSEDWKLGAQQLHHQEELDSGHSWDDCNQGGPKVNPLALMMMMQHWLPFKQILLMVTLTMAWNWQPKVHSWMNHRSRAFWILWWQQWPTRPQEGIHRIWKHALPETKPSNGWMVYFWNTTISTKGRPGNMCQGRPTKRWFEQRMFSSGRSNPMAVLDTRPGTAVWDS